ncbi:MAG TPA: TatD family hydrolase [Acidimicrobiales bacterium]|nr:TatD family hydrolase [Acidimicrobiales bacterium]
MTEAGVGPGVPAWIDSHCHVQDAYRPDGTDEPAVLAAAAAAGVSGLICIGTDADSSRQAVAFVERSRSSGAVVDTWATVGLHPHEARHGVDEVDVVLREAVKSRPGVVVAVGECGLDFHYEHSPRPAQRQAFAAQIELARRHGLALVVHTRSAWDETFDILEVEQAERVVMHCFTGGVDEARRCLDMGAYLSFSGIVTFKHADDVRQAVAFCPLERLLVETDSPFLAPVPHRGRDNHPAWVSLVGEAVAAVKGVPAEAVATASNIAAHIAFALS